MNPIKVIKIKNDNKEIEELSFLMDEVEQCYSIDQISWENFNYKPKVRFKTAYDETSIFLKFFVKFRHIHI